jgi:ribosomal-protein-alanine N-acetyltransferase
VSFTIGSGPRGLSFEAFHALDAECFPEEPLDRQTFETYLRDAFWTAYCRDALVGYCCVVVKPSLGWIRRLGVAASSRRQGIGKQLLHNALDYCIGADLNEVILYVRSDNTPALQLYESCGFKRVETTYQYVLATAKLRGDRSIPGITVRPITEIVDEDMPPLEPQWSDLRSLHKPPQQYAFIFQDRTGRNIGYCRLTPSFPGCFPFVISEPSLNLISVLLGFKEYLLPEKEILKLTFQDDRLATACQSEGMDLNYTLFKMSRREHG